MKKLLELDGLPRSADVALLLLRLWLGCSMLALHGWGKLTNLFSANPRFPDVLGLGVGPTLALAVLAEFLGSVLLMAGFMTRWAAVLLAATMAVAFAVAHGAKLSGPGNGELAFIYLAGYATLFVAGAGKYSVARR